jgi:long-chain fatty acid transport protein
MRDRHSSIARLTVALALLLPCARAHAGGLYLFDRGARALSMAGAFVASPDDPSALWYNPAGLAESKNQVVADAVLPILLAEFQRTDGEGNRLPSIKARAAPIPLPTLALSHNFGLQHVTFGAGLFAPNMLVMDWEDDVYNRERREREPAPTRYSLRSLKGSLLANLAAGLAVHTKSISIGADVMVPIGTFHAKTALTACDEAACPQPESPDFDASASFNSFPAYGISAVGGLVINLDAVRFGFSAMLPYTLRGTGKLEVKAPSNEIFDDATFEGGRDAELSIKFPLILRAGGQMRPLPYLRMEGVFVWEQWSTQKTIDIDVSDSKLANVANSDDYDVGSISLSRKMKDTWSLRGGFELELPKKWMVVDIDIQLRGGLAFETGAFDDKTLSPLTLDTNKWVLSGGLTVGITDWLRFDSTAGWIFMKNLEVTDGEIRQPQAIRPPQLASASVINNGVYAQEAFFLGGGFRMLLGNDTFRPPTIKRDRRERDEFAAEQAEQGEGPDEPAATGGVPDILDDSEEE